MTGAAPAGSVVSEWRRGWPALLGAFLAISTAWNVVGIALSLFLVPMQAEMGWSRTALSIAPFASLISAFLLPITGLLLDRFGARRIAIAGTIGMGGSFALLAHIPSNPWAFVPAVAALSVSGALVNSFVLARGVASWFQRNLGAAIGILLTGVSAALAILLPLLSTVIAASGWRGGFLAFAGIATFVSLPALLLLFREPAINKDPLGRPVQGPTAFRALVKTPSFQKLAVACFLAALPIGGGINHLIPLLADVGLPAVTIALLGSIYALAIGAGSLVNGALFDRLHPPLVVATTLLLAAAGTLVVHGLGPQSALSLSIGGVALIGVAVGAEGDYITYFSNRLFGPANFARAVSLMALTISIGMACGGLGFAAIFDSVGNYGPALLASIILYIAAAATFLSIEMPPLAGPVISEP